LAATPEAIDQSSPTVGLAGFTLPENAHWTAYELRAQCGENEEPKAIKSPRRNQHYIVAKMTEIPRPLDYDRIG